MLWSNIWLWIHKTLGVLTFLCHSGISVCGFLRSFLLCDMERKQLGQFWWNLAGGESILDCYSVLQKIVPPHRCVAYKGAKTQKPPKYGAFHLFFDNMHTKKFFCNNRQFELYVDDVCISEFSIRAKIFGCIYAETSAIQNCGSSSDLRMYSLWCRFCSEAAASQDDTA